MLFLARAILATLLLVSVAVSPARADGVSHGLIQVFLPAGHGPPVSYDASADVLSISSDVRYRTLLPCASPPDSCVQEVMSGYQTLVANIDNRGTFLGGVYSFVGTAPGLGITTPRLLLAAMMTATDLSIRVSPAPCPLGCNAELLVQVDMKTLFADPVLGDWGTQMWFGGYAYGLVPSSVTSQTMFAVDWTLPGPDDYWVIAASNPVPEPTTATLAATGLLALTMAGLRRARYRAETAG